MLLLTKPGFIKTLNYVNLSEILAEMESRGIESELVDYLQSELETGSPWNFITMNDFIHTVNTLTPSFTIDQQIPLMISELLTELSDVVRFSEVVVNLFD